MPKMFIVTYVAIIAIFVQYIFNIFRTYEKYKSMPESFHYNDTAIFKEAVKNETNICINTTAVCAPIAIIIDLILVLCK